MATRAIRLHRPLKKRWLLVIALSGLSRLAFAQSCAESITGATVPALSALDDTIRSAMKTADIPGGSLAVTYEGRLIYARGYGCADTVADTAVQPDSLMRAASVSKTFTAVAVLQLYQRGALSLDAQVFGPSGILNRFLPASGKTLNPDLLAITVRDLLEHAGGWDRSKVQEFNNVAYGEPLDGLINAAPAALGGPQPGTAEDVIRVMLSQPIQHPPGTYYSYSNFGYCLLGRIVEEVSGLSYEQYVQQEILKPLGIGRQKLGATLQSDTANGEVTYYDVPNAALVQSVYLDDSTPVRRPYGAKLLEVVDSAGEWVVTAVDLCRFIDAIDGRYPAVPALLQTSTLEQMVTDPHLDGEPEGAYYGLGFLIKLFSSGYRWTKNGGLPGTTSIVIHSPTGFSYSFLFNSNPSYGAADDDDNAFSASLNESILSFLNQLGTAVPSGDLYPGFHSSLLEPKIESVVQGATFQPGVVSGSWVSIFGTNLATASRPWMAREFSGQKLPSEVDHVLAMVNKKPAFIGYVSPTQLNIQLPEGLAAGPIDVEVVRDGAVSEPASAAATNNAPGLFSFLDQNVTYALATHADGQPVGTFAGSTPARPGEVIALYATGLAPSLAGTLLSEPIALSPLPEISIGSVDTSVLFAGLISPGLFQINIQVPVSASGSQVISARYGGQSSPFTTVLVVEPESTAKQ